MPVSHLCIKIITTSHINTRNITLAQTFLRSMGEVLTKIWNVTRIAYVSVYTKGWDKSVLPPYRSFFIASMSLLEEMDLTLSPSSSDCLLHHIPPAIPPLNVRDILPNVQSAPTGPPSSWSRIRWGEVPLQFMTVSIVPPSQTNSDSIKTPTEALISFHGHSINVFQIFNLSEQMRFEPSVGQAVEVMMSH